MSNLITFLNSKGVVRNGHFILTSGLHSDIYVDKSAITSPATVNWLGGQIGDAFSSCEYKDMPNIVVSPATGAIVFGFAVASYFSERFTTLGVNFIHADKNKSSFSLRNSGEKMLADKRVLIVEDVITTGVSVKKLLEEIHKFDPIIIGVGCLINRGTIKVSDLKVPKLISLLELKSNTWTEQNCPLCKQGIPFNRK